MVLDFSLEVGGAHRQSGLCYPNVFVRGDHRNRWIATSIITSPPLLRNLCARTARDTLRRCAPSLREAVCVPGSELWVVSRTAQNPQPTTHDSSRYLHSANRVFLPHSLLDDSLVEIVDERDHATEENGQALDGRPMFGGERGLHLQELQLGEHGSERVVELMLRERRQALQVRLPVRITGRGRIVR